MSALLCLHDSDLLEAIKCTPLSSTVISSFYGTMGVSDFLLSVWISIAFLWFDFHTSKGDNRTSAVLYYIFIINLAKFSDWGTFLFPHRSGYRNVVCCDYKHIDRFQPHNNFPAQSLHFRFGSVAPCPTLKSNVTASTPRTWYGRLARPYPTGFSCYIQSAYKSKWSFLHSLEEISSADFSAHTIHLYYIIRQRHFLTFFFIFIIIIALLNTLKKI